MTPGLLLKQFAQGLTAGFEPRRVTACMEYGKHHNLLGFDQKVNHKRKASNNGAPYVAPHPGEPFRIVRDLAKVVFDRRAKLAAQAGALPIVPSDGIIEFLGRDPPENQGAAHLLYLASNLALT